MLYSMTFLMALAAVGMTAGQSPSPTRTRLQLDLELHRRREPPTKPIAHESYADAFADARSSGKPLFVTVATDCSALCPKLRGEFVIAHLREFEGSSKPRAALLMPGADGLYKVREWSPLPSDGDVKKAAEEWKPRLPPMTPTRPTSVDWSKAT